MIAYLGILAALRQVVEHINNNTDHVIHSLLCARYNELKIKLLKSGYPKARADKEFPAIA